MPENCAAIIIAAKHHELVKVKDTRGTTNTVGALRCKFDFRTQDWQHSAKTAMFCNGDVILHPEVIKNAIAVPLDEDNECAVPYEVLTDTLPYSIGVWGVTDSGLRVVSNWLVFNAQVGCYAEGNAPSNPEQTVYDEILLISKKAVDAANAVTQRADNGEFKGDNGIGIADVVKISTENNIDTYQIKYTDDSTSTFKITNGIDGVGISNAVINANKELVLSMTSGEVVNLGRVVGIDGKDGYTPIKGIDYFDGKNGLDGKTPIFKVDGGMLYIRYDEKESWTLLGNIQGADGLDGVNGKDGRDGISPVIRINEDVNEWEVSYDNGATWVSLDVKATGANGKDGEAGYTPVKGTDYYTEADKQEMVNNVLSELSTDWEQNDATKADYIKNRTHYEEITTVNEPLNITWDGNTEGLVCVSDIFYKVSDLVLTDEQIKSGTITMQNGETISISEMWEMLVSYGAVCDEFVDADALVTFIRKENVNIIDETYNEPGIYFLNNAYSRVSSFTTTEPVEQATTVVHKLDKKYLPDDIGGIKYVTIGQDNDGNYTASATYAQISEWIKAGLEVKCVYGEDVLSLVSSSIMSDIGTFAARWVAHVFHGTIIDGSFEQTIYILDTDEIEYRGYEYALRSDIPTKVSQLTNDSGYALKTEIPEQVQADWDQTDEAAVDFVKNKTHGTVMYAQAEVASYTETTVGSSVRVTLDPVGYLDGKRIRIHENAVMELKINDTVFSTNLNYITKLAGLTWGYYDGNPVVIRNILTSSDTKVYIVQIDFTLAAPAVVSAQYKYPTTQTLDEKYIPDTIARKTDIPYTDVQEVVDLVLAALPTWEGGSY